MLDSEVPWTAARRAAVAEPLYRASDEHNQFKYLPASAMLAIPLGLLPLPVAKGILFVSSVALLITLIAFSIHLLPERTSTALLTMSAIVVQSSVTGALLAIKRSETCSPRRCSPPRGAFERQGAVCR
jgi:hypothetical protein